MSATYVDTATQRPQVDLSNMPQLDVKPKLTSSEPPPSFADIAKASNDVLDPNLANWVVIETDLALAHQQRLLPHVRG